MKKQLWPSLIRKKYKKSYHINDLHRKGGWANFFYFSRVEETKKKRRKILGETLSWFFCLCRIPVQVIECVDVTVVVFQGLMFKTPYLNLAYFPLQCHYLRTVFFLKKIFMLNYCHYNIHMIKFIYAGNPANRRQYDFPAACQCVCGMYAIFTVCSSESWKIFKS